ncbi:unnamed protein product [Paramecium pentaurelia]|uniref:Uncharacterized protein n=1 Tax=Paramecium pentaurelia TaxID=43138 RepID=A0A8S1VK68_9CILI|nr:unnamed protein product [Paramecium pentaurelia]
MLNSINGQLLFTLSNTIDGLISIKNILISALNYYTSCKQYTGPKFNQYTSCYYGLPANNICQPCPFN